MGPKVVPFHGTPRRHRRWTDRDPAAHQLLANLERLRVDRPVGYRMLRELAESLVGELDARRRQKSG